MGVLILLTKSEPTEGSGKVAKEEMERCFNEGSESVSEVNLALK